MTATNSQMTYQVRLGWGEAGLTQLAESNVIVIVDALESVSGDRSGNASSTDLAERALALQHRPTVYRATLRNAKATATAIYEQQLAEGGRVSINLVLAGDDGNFAVEDYLAAGAVADVLTSLGIDHSAPDVAVAAEGLRALSRAVKHLVSASAAGLALKQAGRGAEVKHAAELNADGEADRLGA